MKNKVQEESAIQLEISIEKLALLFESGLLCAAEVRCLTADSKQRISDLCLSTCAKKITCNKTFFNERPTAQVIHLKSNKIS